MYRGRPLPQEVQNLEEYVAGLLGDFRSTYEWKGSLGYLFVRHRELAWKADSLQDSTAQDRIQRSLERVFDFASRQRQVYVARVLDELGKDAESLSTYAREIPESTTYSDWDNELDVRSGAEELLKEARRLGVDASGSAAKVDAFDRALRHHAKELRGTIDESYVRDVPPIYWWWHACARNRGEESPSDEGL